nr:hypothetical protein [Tanacetum cinerariifolium]
MANVLPNDPNVDAPAIIPALVNPDHAPAQPVGLGNGFAPHWIGDNISNNQNVWIEEDAEEEEEDPEEDPKEDPKEEPEDDDDDIEMDDEAEVTDPYMDDGSNNPSPPNSEDEETPLTSLVILDADGQPIPPIASFGQNFHFGESSSTANLLTGNSKIVPTGPICPNLGTTWKRLGKMEKFMSERIETEGRIKKKFKEQDRHFLGLGCDNIEMDRTVRNVMSDLSRLKRLVKGLSDRFDEYERSKVFNAKRVLEKELDHSIVRVLFSFIGVMVKLFIHDMDMSLKTWAEMKVMMMEEFCPPEEIQRMEVILCPGMVPTERKKVEAYIRGLSKNIKGGVTSSEPATLNKVVRMAHTLMEHKIIMANIPLNDPNIIMANIPLNDPNVDTPAIAPAPVNPDHTPAQPVGLGDGFAPYWIGNNIPNNQNGWIEEDAEEEEEDPEEDPKEDPEEEPEDDDDDIKMDDEAEVIDPYMDDGSNNLPPLNSKDKETPPTSLVVPDADGQPIPPIASFGQNFHFGESSSTANLLTRNSKIVPTGPMCPNLGTAWKRLGKMEKFMSERIDTEGRIKKKFKEQDRYFLGLGCNNIEVDRTVRKVMSNLSGLKKLVKGLSDRFDEYERSKVFDAKRVLEKELVNERNGKEFYREFREYIDAAIADAAIATFGIDDDDDDTAPMDSQPHNPCGSLRDTQTMSPRKSTRGNPPPPLTQDTVNRMIQESVEAAIRAERENFMKCSPITFHGNEGAVGLIRWIEKMEMVFTVATSRIEVVTRKTWAEMKVMMTEEFCPPEEIQRIEGELWNLRVKEMDVSSYTTRFNELVILCPGMVPTERKKVEAYIRRLLENIKGEVTSSEPATLNKAVRMTHTLI